MPSMCLLLIAHVCLFVGWFFGFFVGECKQLHIPITVLFIITTITNDADQYAFNAKYSRGVESPLCNVFSNLAISR